MGRWVHSLCGTCTDNRRDGDRRSCFRRNAVMYPIGGICPIGCDPCHRSHSRWRTLRRAGRLRRPDGRSADLGALGGPEPCSRSARMSSMPSMPTASRTRPGVTPVASCSAAESWLCVVEAGWITRQRTSPMLATWLCSSSASTNALAGLHAARRSRRPARHRLPWARTCPQLVPRAGRQPGVVHASHLVGGRRATRRPRCAFCTCRSTRRLSVSRPWAIRKALNGDAAGPGRAAAAPGP